MSKISRFLIEQILVRETQLAGTYLSANYMDQAFPTDDDPQRDRENDKMRKNRAQNDSEYQLHFREFYKMTEDEDDDGGYNNSKRLRLARKEVTKEGYETVGNERKKLTKISFHSDNKRFTSRHHYEDGTHVDHHYPNNASTFGGINGVRQHVKDNIAAYHGVPFEDHTIKEDAPANCVGAGHIAGAAPGEDPPIGRKAQKKKQRVNEADQFAGSPIFDVDPDHLFKSRLGKHPRHRYSRYVGDDETGETIRSFGRDNPKANIVLRDKTTGAMTYLRRKAPQD